MANAKAERETMDLNDFRVVTSSSVYRKGSTTIAGGMMITGGGGQNANRYRYTLGEISSTNITLDVNVGTGWTRIRLKEVPKFIVHAFNMITKYGMEVDGIFRKEGNSARLNRAEVQTIYKGGCDIPNDYTVIDVCTMVKRFLRDLKPTLLDSDEFRGRLLKKACASRISNCFVMTRDEMADMFYADERQMTPLLSEIHCSTLGYVMRQLYRISLYSETHKMSIENLAVVLVGSVFGDGIHDSKKSGQVRRGSRDDILAQKKQDIDVNVAAVRLLITNANLIGVRRDPYVTSNAMLRSSSAMPRCMSSGYETGSSDADCLSTKTSSTLKSSTQEASGSSHIYRRDSEAAHKIVTSRKKGDGSAANKKKRSASFLPSFRDIRHRLTNMKRAKSPSPERLMTGGPEPEPRFSDLQDPEHHKKKVARNDSNTGSTASGRQSRSQQSRRGGTNAAPRLAAKIFDSSDSKALRRLSASDQNSRLSNEIMNVTEFLMSEHRQKDHQKEEEVSKTRIVKRNTVILGEASSRTTKQTNRRHTAPIHNNKPRRNRPNTVGTGLPQQQRNLHNAGSSMEEKENQGDVETDLDEPAKTLDRSEWLLEQKALEARSRRAGRKQQKQTPGKSTERSMETKDPKDLKTPSILRKDLEDVKKFCDMATSPHLVLDSPRPHNHENGHVWVGTKQVVTVTPSPALARRQSRARLSYSKANESPLDMPSSTASRRESSPLMSSIMHHTMITNNSPPAQMVTSSGGASVSPRTCITPKSHSFSPLALRMETPPPVPFHSPPHLTPQVSSSRSPLEGASAELKRITISGSTPRRPPTPPSHPKMSNPFSPKLPIRSVTIDNGFELPKEPTGPSSSNLFKLPQLPKKIAPTQQKQQLSPLVTHRNQPHSRSTISVKNLRESKSIDLDSLPLRSAPLHGSGRSSPTVANDYFEFGKYTNALRTAQDEFALPSRLVSVEPRPSVAIIRSNNCGLVKSRVHHFQEIEQLQRIDSAMSGRLSALSQTSLRSNDTHPSSSDRYSDVSDLRHNLTPSESNRSLNETQSTPTSTPTATRVSSHASPSTSSHHF